MRGDRHSGTSGVGNTDYDSKNDLGGKIYEAIVGRMDTFDSGKWMQARSALNVDGDELEILVPSEFFGGYVQKCYREIIDSATEEVTGRSLGVRYMVDEEAYGLLKKDIITPTVEVGQQEEFPKPTEGFKPRSPNYIYKPKSKEFAARMDALTFPGLEEEMEEHYVRHEGNKLAGGACRRIFVDVLNGGKSKGSALLYGGSGVGKTALLKSVRETLKNKGIATGYVDIEQIAQFLTGNRGKFPPIFDHLSERDIRLIMFDGAEALTYGSRPGIRKKVDAAIRGARLKGVPVIITCANQDYEKVIAEIKPENENLAATLERMPPILMSTPSGDGAVNVTKSFLLREGRRVRRGSSLESIAIALVGEIPEGSSVKYIEGKVGVVTIAADVYKKPLSEEFVREILSRGVQETLDLADVTPEGIVREVAARYKLTEKEMREKRRDGIFPTARAEAALEIKERLGLSNGVIGSYLGDMHPSSILVAIKKAKKRKEESPATFKN